jgi:hypothetical protein
VKEKQQQERKKTLGQQASVQDQPTNHNHSKANLVYKTRQDHPTHCTINNTTINNTNLPFYMSP